MLLATVKLIAEPWDLLGPRGISSGDFLLGGLGWNDKFRMMCAIFGAASSLPQIWRIDSVRRRLSSIIQGRQPWSCVNFVTAHDTFPTLMWRQLAQA